MTNEKLTKSEIIFIEKLITPFDAEFKVESNGADYMSISANDYEICVRNQGHFVYKI